MARTSVRNKISKGKGLAGGSGIQDKISFLLEQKLNEITRQTGEELNAKDVDLLVKLANLQEKMGGRSILAASVAVIEELLSFLEERNQELRWQLEEHLEEFFSRMRSDYE